MNLRLLISLAAIVFVAGCHTTTRTPSGSTFTHRDSVAGPDLDMTLDNLLQSSEDRSYLVWLNAVRIRDGAWDARYYLEVRYEGASDAGFMDIGPGENLTVTVDGQPLRFRGPGSRETRRVLGSGHYVENAVFEARAEDLRRISRAKEVQVQVNGNQRRMYREFQPENFQRFRSFVLLHMGY